MVVPDEPLDKLARSDGAGWRQLLLDSIRGGAVDLTTARVDRCLLTLGVPMVVEMLVESSFAIVDIYWVTRLGSGAVAIVGLTESLMMLLYPMAIGVSIGVSALVARRIGEKQCDQAARLGLHAIALAITIATVFAILGVPYATELLDTVGADSATSSQGTAYARLMLGGNVSVFLLFVNNGILRGAGTAAAAMRVLWLGNAINVLLAPCCIFGIGPFPALGVTGAAVAANLSRGCAVLYQAYLLTRCDGVIAFHRVRRGVDMPTVVSLLRLSSGAMLQRIVPMTSYVAVIRLLSEFGSSALAGYVIGYRIYAFAILPAFGLANAAATVVGHNLGAGRADRAEEAVLRACLVGAVILGIEGLVVFCAAVPIVDFFTPLPAVGDYAVAYLRIVSLGFPFYAVGMTLTEAFNGSGDVRTPTLINIMVFWLLQIPFAAILSHSGNLHAHGVFIALAICFALVALVSWVPFRGGRWKCTCI